MTQICYTAPFLDATGYGEASRNAIQALHAAGADIKTQRVKFTATSFDGGYATKICEELSTRDIPYKIKVLHTTPDVYKNYREPGKYHIGHLFWETSKLPSSWVTGCNLMNEIWTGTELNAKSIKDSGVTVPVYVYPQSINVNVPEVRPYNLPNFKGLVFYSIMDWRERKNPRKLLNAFWKEFKGLNDVCLLIKSGSGDYNKEQIENIIKDAKAMKNELGFKDTPRVFICTSLLNEEDKHRLHETGDCFVSAHRGEGWGLPQVEALLHTKVVISTAYGGVHEYLKGKHYKRLRYELVTIDKVYNKYYEPGMLWAEADEADLRDKMRNVYTLWNSDAKTKRMLFIPPAVARKMIEMEFNYGSVGKMMHDRLKEIEAKL